jgi:hypothetical protein
MTSDQPPALTPGELVFRLFRIKFSDAQLKSLLLEAV